jgi:hypothetical protein
MEDDGGDDETKKDSDNAIADFIEVGVRRVSLKHA